MWGELQKIIVIAQQAASDTQFVGVLERLFTANLAHLQLVDVVDLLSDELQLADGEPALHDGITDIADLLSAAIGLVKVLVKLPDGVCLHVGHPAPPYQ